MFLRIAKGPYRLFKHRVDVVCQLKFLFQFTSLHQDNLLSINNAFQGVLLHLLKTNNKPPALAVAASTSKMHFGKTIHHKQRFGALLVCGVSWKGAFKSDLQTLLGHKQLRRIIFTWQD